MSNTKQIAETIKNLRNCTIDAAHRRVDWSELLGEDLEGWQAFGVEDCDGCDREVVCSSHMGQDEHRYIEPEITVTDEDGDEDEIENECMSHLYFEGPMMNFFYPCELEDLEAAARAISRLPLCVVEMGDGETGFALTGGGMDLSWEICAAYIACGFLPPVEYCDLPNMAGRGKYHSDTALILAACRRSCEISQQWAERKRERLAELAKGYEVELPE